MAIGAHASIVNDSHAEALVTERKLSDLVNRAYGLSPDDVRLMWETAPTRMPFARAET